MKIYPQDLGRVGYRVMLYLRAQAREEGEAVSKPEEALTLTPVTGLRRAWLRGSGVPEKMAQHAPPAFTLCRRAIWSGSPFGLVGTLFCSFIAVWFLAAFVSYGFSVPAMLWLYPLWALVGAGVIYYATMLRPRRVFQELHGALTEWDIAQMRKQVRDPLASDFLGVVALLLPLPALRDAEAEKSLRQALYALGEAIEELPQQAPQAVGGSPAQMRTQAGELRDAATGEPDSVVAASLERRAHSLARRAQTVASIAVLLRRNQTLREEVAEQIEALRTSVLAFSVGSHQSAHELADLAASIQHVAEEANAITLAHLELEPSAYTSFLPAGGEENAAVQAWQRIHP